LTSIRKIKETVNGSIQVLDTNAYINGPQVQQFQKSLESILMHVIPCANGTDFTNCDDGFGFKTGDEVITADFTFAATVEVIALLQLTRFS
jgi:dTDP-4-amino-4,6-dideoxygalactose transaminase